MTVTWITYEEADAMPGNGLGFPGGFVKHGMRWPDYLAAYPNHAEYLEALRKSILENNICAGGDAHQHSGERLAPLFSDGTATTFSYRAWGDLLAAVWGSELGRDLRYMDFYMDATRPADVLKLIAARHKD